MPAVGTVGSGASTMTAADWAALAAAAAEPGGLAYLSAESGQTFDPTTLDSNPSALGLFLGAVRQHESGGNYTAYNAAGGASGAYQYIQSTWTSEANAAGYGQYAGGPASSAPPAVQDAVAAYNAQSIFNSTHSWKYVAENWYYPAYANPADQGLVPVPSAGNTETIGAYGDQILSMMGSPNAPSVAATGGAVALDAGMVSYLNTLDATTRASVEDYLNITGAQNAAIPGGTGTGGQTTGQVAATNNSTINDIIASVLQPYGLDVPAVQSWVQTQVTALASQGMTSSAIATQIGIELQAPNLSSDPGTAAAQQVFQSMYPGMALRQKAGLPPITITQYQQYQDAVYQTAEAAGIKPYINQQTIGALLGADVSATEVADRINKGFQAAAQANPETLKLLQEYYPTLFPQGTAGQAPSTGALVAYYLDPKNTQATLDNQITAAQIGTEGVNSQFGGIPVAQAQTLQQAGVTQQTARDTFRTLAKLTPLETTLPGTASPNAAMSQQDLVNYGFFGANQQELENVQSNRKAPFSGGGGYAATAKGIVGAGGASQEGTQGT
jgi:hypothetical protein